MYSATVEIIATHAIRTAGSPAALKIEVEQGDEGLKADYDDIILVKISVVDANGIVHPMATNFITLEVLGPGNVIGVGNGDPSSHEPDKASSRSAWNGLMRGIIQTTNEPGEITIIARSENLRAANVTIHSRAPKTPALTFNNFLPNSIARTSRDTSRKKISVPHSRRFQRRLF